MSIIRRRITIAVTLLLIAALVGVTAAWVQDFRDRRTLAGQVTDEQSRQPVAAALVRVTRGGQEQRETRTDESGRYSLGIGDGPLAVTVAAAGYHPTSGPFQADDPFVSEFPLNVVLRPYVVSGIIKDNTTQKPIAGASVSAGDLAAQTQDTGRFTLARVPPGSTVKAEASGYYPHETAWNGENNIEFYLMPRIIAIAVHDAASGQPLKATVLVDGTRYEADAHGRLVLPEPDTLTSIRAYMDDYLNAEATYTGQALVELPLKPGAFKGLLKDARTGRPVASATVYVDGTASATSSDQGRFGLAEVQAGTALKVKAAGYRILEMPAPAASSAEIPLQPFTVRGVYLPFGLLALEGKVREIIDLVDRTELNAIVVDVKGDRGRLAFRSDNPVIKAVRAEQPGMDLRELLRVAREKKIYMIARIVVFKDEPLARARLDLVVKTRSGAIWRDGEDLAWANPYSREVWAYNLAIAKEVAALGFDEIQFDYIRFPSDGDVSAIFFPPPHTAQTRAAALKGFLSEANRTLKPYAVFISADLFGLTLWTRDDMGIGQRLEEIAPLVDYLQPMVYPSTFAPSNLGYQNPSLHPYEVVYRSVKAGAERVRTLIRPWLQAYSSRDVAYGLAEFLAQKRAANDAGSAGWTFWNAGGQYNPGVFAGQ